MRELYAGRLTEAHVSGHAHAHRSDLFFWVPTSNCQLPTANCQLSTFQLQCAECPGSLNSPLHSVHIPASHPTQS